MGILREPRNSFISTMRKMPLVVMIDYRNVVVVRDSGEKHVVVHLSWIENQCYEWNIRVIARASAWDSLCQRQV